MHSHQHVCQDHGFYKGTKVYTSFFYQQECIPVGCVPPAHWPYLIISYACPPRKNHTPLQEKPCMPPGKNHVCPPGKNHACPLGKPRMPPWEKPCMPPGKNHACPWEKPHMPPGSNHAQPPGSNHTCPPRSNHACPIPLGATTHAPPSNHACPPS